MTGARGIAIAGLVALTVTSAHAIYRSWPATHGVEIAVPAALVRQPGGLEMVSVQLPLARIALDVPHTGPAVTETFESVRRLGDWWVTGGDALVNMRRLRGRPLYLQLTAGQPAWPGGPAEMRPSTVSVSAVAGATNLAGVVSRVREDGYVWLDFSFGWISVPGPLPPSTDPGVFAVVRVLPSGRATLTGVIVNGTRH